MGSMRGLAAAGVIAACCGLAHAQSGTAVLSGRVTDRAGDGLPGVVVAISSRSEPTGTKQVRTDLEGNYRIPLLPPASDYLITVDYPGFAPLEVGPLNLDAGRAFVQNLTLSSIEESSVTIRVVGEAHVVDTTKTSTSTTYDHEFIEALPIIGHSYQDVVCLAPGVTDTDGDGNPNVHGARDTGMQWRVDGGNITDPVDGGFAQNLNPALIEEIEVISTGAPAEFGGADGGFANIISKSGGNQFEGSFSIFWRGKFLDGDGADNNDQNGFDRGFPQFQDVRPTLTLSGAIAKDRLWYIASVERIRSERPVDTIDQNILVTVEGNFGFGKLTWQPDSDNKLSLQVTSDPLTFRGLGLGTGVSPDSDFIFEQSTLVPQLKWTATLSPALLLESVVTHLDSRTPLTPVSEHFQPTEVRRVSTSNNIIQAYYPCDVPNCNPQLGEKRTFVNDLVTNRVSGPFFFMNEQRSGRNAIKTDLSYTTEGAGQHSLRAGMEFQDEDYTDVVTRNPILFDQTRPFQPTPTSGGGAPSVSNDLVSGVQTLQTASPLHTPQQVNRFSSAAYLQDSWKPLPNLTINAGLRIEREDIDTSGFGAFDPKEERRSAIARWYAFCQEAHLQGQILGTSSNCYDLSVYDGLVPDNFGPVAAFRDGNGDGVNDVDPRVQALDGDRDGSITGAGSAARTDGAAFYQDFTRFADRETSNFTIVNTNLAPRLSISWDPTGTGKTKVFLGYGRYWDRLFLRTVSGEIGPDLLEFDFVPDPTTHRIDPGDTSVAVSKVSINQVDRGLRTPRTDELTIGFERELAPEWSIGVTWIRRTGEDLLQDLDINHVSCPQYGELGIDPMIVCGDAGVLETDRFGDLSGRRVFGGSTAGGDFGFDPTAGGLKLPNGVPDLYTVNNGFNRILRVGNYNSSRYQAYELRILRRLHRHWQLNASYTWSEAYGQAEAFGDLVGNDPETTDEEEGFLSFDVRHLLRVQAVMRLRHEVQLGTTVEWRSGLPYSIIATTGDFDSTGNSAIRRFFPTGQRNDQRNDGQWKLDGRIEKSFRVGRVQASAFLTAENLLNSDDLTIQSYDLSSIDGTPLAAFRNLGRRFEIGTVLNF